MTNSGRIPVSERVKLPTYAKKHYAIQNALATIYYSNSNLNIIITRNINFTDNNYLISRDLL
jgi:hypothetical protein